MKPLFEMAAVEAAYLRFTERARDRGDRIISLAQMRHHRSFNLAMTMTCLSMNEARDRAHQLLQDARLCAQRIRLIDLERRATAKRVFATLYMTTPSINGAASVLATRHLATSSTNGAAS